MSNESAPMPGIRPHPCFEANVGGIPVAWIEYCASYGFSLETTNMFGEESTTDIVYCPWCGDKLQTEEMDAKLADTIRVDRKRGIRINGERSK